MTKSSSPIIRSLESDPLTCGLAEELRLSVAFDPPRIQLSGSTSLHGEAWVYGFDPSCDDASVLRLCFTPRATGVVGYAVAIDTAGAWIGEPAPLADEKGVLVYSCPRPREGEEPSVLIFFELADSARATSSSSQGQGQGQGRGRGKPKPVPTEIVVEPPTEAQPKLILRPKRNCPTGDGKTGPTDIT